MNIIGSLLTKIGIKWLSGKLDGYKSSIGGFGAFLMGILYALPLVVPSVADVTGIQGNQELALACFTLAFTTWGIAGKLQKQIDIKPQ